MKREVAKKLIEDVVSKLKDEGLTFSADDDVDDEYDNNLPCEREWDNDGWWCINDHTGCLYNDGHNTCMHEGDSCCPLDEE